MTTYIFDSFQLFSKKNTLQARNILGNTVLYAPRITSTIKVVRNISTTISMSLLTVASAITTSGFPTRHITAGPSLPALSLTAHMQPFHQVFDNLKIAAQRYLFTQIGIARFAAPPPGNPGLRAADFNASVGVNVQIAPDPQWFNAVQAAFFGYIRSGFDRGSTELSRYATLRTQGVYISGVADPRSNTAAQAVTYLTNNASSFDAAEGPNEPDANQAAFGGSSWPTTVRNYMAALSSGIRGAPSIASKKIIAPSMASACSTGPGGSFQSLGNIVAYCDYSNTHPYPGQGTRGWYDTLWTNCIQAGSAIICPGEQTVCTETGIPLTGGSSGQPQITDAQYGKLVLLIYAEQFRVGMPYTAVYVLVEDGQGFGLMTEDASGNLTARSSYNAIKAMNTLIRDTVANARSFNAVQLGYTLTGATANTRQLDLQKADGSHWILIWEQSDLVSGSPASVTINLPRAMSGAVYKPSSNGTTAVATITNQSSVAITSLNGELTIVNVA